MSAADSPVSEVIQSSRVWRGLGLALVPLTMAGFLLWLALAYSPAPRTWFAVPLACFGLLMVGLSWAGCRYTDARHTIRPPRRCDTGASGTR